MLTLQQPQRFRQTKLRLEDKIEDEVKADLYVVAPLWADGIPDMLRTDLEEALDTLSYNVRRFPTLLAD